MARRNPAVAGLFYPSSSEMLKKKIEECFLHPIGPRHLPLKVEGDRLPPLAIISPHAGYVYSGPVAAHGYLQLDGRKKPKTVIVIGPNHYGIGTDISVYPEGVWITPLGSVKIDSELARELVNYSSVISLDEVSHIREHSIEVQVPFLQYVLGDFMFLPICMLDQSIEASLELGEVLGEVLKKRKDIMLVASTDFSHYEPHEVAVRKDSIALEKIKNLDLESLYRVIREMDITMCGYGPVATVLKVARELDVKEAELLKYATSGDVTGDRASVVGYGSLKIEHL
ncbi:MAG: AmmeMemoRadiSam system protein B [Nitrososphaeria archaeon]|nr:AmmeMemoRadiSam system protein B [Nitrososphaeria archaeon]MDW7986421.1 AmmeMemoRadiSam system protein B [Nitrososphaerota archaeon]